MIKPLRLILACLCAEYLLIFRCWVAPPILLLLVVTAGVRAAVISNTPHFLASETMFYFATFSLIMHLRGLLRNKRNRDIHETPDTGVPWLVLIAQSPKAAIALEIVLCMCAVWFYFPATPLRVPPGRIEDPELFTLGSAMASVFALTLWNAIHNRVPKVNVLQKGGLQYKPVKQQSHRVRLPSVRQMMEGLDG